MAILSKNVQAHASHAEIEAWTAQTANAINALTIANSSGTKGATITLAIDLDEDVAPQGSPKPRRKLHRRDSLDRREALLRGKEGSRRRIRWENDRLMNNPWAQPPQASDWEVHPTHPRHTVPYYLAPMWDRGLAAEAQSRQDERVRQSTTSRDIESQGRIPKELREKLKKAKAAKGLLRDLEEDVRHYMLLWESENADVGRQDFDSEDEEIVFVGRNGRMRNSSPLTHCADLQAVPSERLILDSPANDQGASFGRWLVHSIASYYGLPTWSLTAGNPARRQAYVGMPECHPRKGTKALPTPLWVMV